MSFKGDNKAEYQAWVNMRHRCYSPNHKQYKDYGARGITVCSEWQDDFAAFLKDVGKRPHADMQLERLNNHEGYKPGNVTWASRSDQSMNRRSATLLTIRGETKNITQWAREAGLSRQCVRNRIVNLGWSPEDAVFTPKQL